MHDPNIDVEFPLVPAIAEMVADNLHLAPKHVLWLQLARFIERTASMEPNPVRLPLQTAADSLRRAIANDL